MSILDDAIREHLELKRAHGADEVELKKLEDEAFGPPARPDEQDPLTEAPTEFMAAETAEGTSEGGDAAASGRRMPNIADLQEAPEPPKEEAAEKATAAEEVSTEHEPAAEEESAEHEIVPEPDSEAPADSEPSHSTEERHAIAEQPTELFDVEGEIEAAPDAKTSPSDEELADAEMTEPRLAPVDPIDGVDASAAEPKAAEEEAEVEDEFDEYFSEQRLSDELSQALDAPLEGEPSLPSTDEHRLSDEAEVADTGEHEAASDEHEYEDAERYEEEDDEGQPREGRHDEAHQDEAQPEATQRDSEDVLEETPDFLEDAPEDDNLWFEQRPPKDFDFDD
jgi:hypothetical protein